MEKKQALSSLQLQRQTAATPDSPLSSGPNTPLWKLIIVASIAAGIQFGWALQQSLLSPYVQLLGIPHAWVSVTWLCGPISGLLVQPIVGYYSDNCSSRFGRRTPFIASGAAFVAIAVFLIGYAADIGHMAGDAVDKTPKTRAVAVYVVGFWILDVANNMLQGPCRALLADLCGINHQKTRTAFAFFAFFMAVGSVLGYAAGSYSHLYKVFPFTKTHACDVYCANLKSCFFISIFLLATLTFLALVTVREMAFTPDEQEKPGQADESEKVTKLKNPFFGELVGAFKDLPKPMWILLLVTCLNWIAWFPFIVYGTDWMGREVYGGTVGQKMYDLGVRTGALGLMFNSVALGFTSLGIVFLVRKIGGVKKLWGCANFLLAVCLAFMVLVTKIAQRHRGFTTTPGGSITPLQPSTNVKACVLTLFFVLGIPLAVTFSVPFALASNFSSSSGAGQGLSLGVLNLAIVIPQLFVAAVSGHWDALFGGGNLPSFVVGAIAAAVSGIFALTILPSPPEIADKMVGAAGGFH